MLLVILALLLASLYIILQCYYLYQWHRTPVVSNTFSSNSPVRFTVIVVAHNEEASIGECLRGIIGQNYPDKQVEIIVINDRSTDKTVEQIHLINSSRVFVFNLQDFPGFIHLPAYKKSAITLGVHQAKNDWIVVSDADCIHGRDWLSSIASTIQSTDNLFLTAPIVLQGPGTLLSEMQKVETIALMVVTAAGIRKALHDIASGANMAFAKSAFLNVNGYEGNYEYASGDDMFLAEKIRLKIGNRIGFVKSPDAAVKTCVKESWSSLIRQRLRWEGKNKGLDRPVIRFIWGFIGIYHAALLLTFCLALVSLTSFTPFLILFIPKLVLDFILIKAGADFLKVKMPVLLFIPLQVMYTIYVLYLGFNIWLGRKGDW